MEEYLQSEAYKEYVKKEFEKLKELLNNGGRKKKVLVSI